MLTKKPTIRQITAAQTKSVSLPGQRTNNPHPNSKNSPIPSTPAVRTYSTQEPVEKLSIAEVLFLSALFVCFATPLAAFILLGAAGLEFLGCLTIAFWVFLGTLFLTYVTIVALVFWRAIVTLASVIFVLWLLLLAVRFFAN